MTNGGIDVKPRIREILRFSSLFLPVILAFYGVFIRPNALYNPYSGTLFSVIMLLWILVGMILFLFPAKQKTGIIIRLVAYHVCVVTYITLVSGFFAPFITVGWLLLLLASYIYLSKTGLVLNLAFLTYIIIVDIVTFNGNSRLLLSDLVAVASIFIIGAFIILLNRIQQGDSQELLRSRADEALQRDRLNTLINNLADAVISTDSEGKVEVYNAASLNLLNTNANLYSQSIDDIIKLRDQSDKAVKLFAMAKKSRGMKMRDDLSLDIDDETIRLEVTVSPVRSSYSRSKGVSSTDGYVLILRDITKAKSLEEERDEFISVVSHELRTPITIVEGTLSNVQILAERGNMSPAVLRRSLADAHEQTMFLSKMVNDLSTLSRAERGVADAAEKIMLDELLHNLYNEYGPQAEKKQLQFNLDAPGQLGSVTASPLYLRELLQNLITNAIKYTKEGSVTLRASRDGKRVRLEVADTGIGISKGDQQKIFNKFYRSEDYRTRETGGTGLGLYVAAKLSKKLGTVVEVKSRLNHGSTFGFMLPVDDENQSEAD